MRGRIVTGAAACLAAAIALAGEQASPPPPSPAEVARLVAALAGPDALAEHRAGERLVEIGDPAVGALAGLAGRPGPRPPRLIAVEMIGRIGTPAAMDALIDLLRRERGELAVRGQACMQLGYARERRAVGALIDWLKTIGPHALDDVKGPKEIQPATCYLRHVEALGMIGDPAALPALEEFLAKLPKNVGYGGFLTNFVAGGVREAIEEIREQAAFDAAVAARPGLEAKLAPLFAYLRSDPAARFRQQADEVIRRTAEGRAVLRRLTGHRDGAVAASAKALLAVYDELDLSGGGPAGRPGERR